MASASLLIRAAVRTGEFSDPQAEKYLADVLIQRREKIKSAFSKFHSKDIRRGSYSRTLTRRGTYKILCSIHPDMRETIRVS